MMRLFSLILFVGCYGASCSSNGDHTVNKKPATPTKSSPSTSRHQATADAGPVTKEGDCQTTYAPRPKRDVVAMCRVQGGMFWLGAPKLKPPLPRHKDTLWTERPRQRVRVSSFYIDQLEVTNAQFAKFLNATGGNSQCHGWEERCVQLHSYMVGKPDPFVVKHGIYRPGPGFDQLPVDSASIEGAERYCAWAGKRLPTNAEWEYAARHDPRTNRDYRYPWGDTFDLKRANCAAHPRAPTLRRLMPVGSYDGTRGRGDGRSPWGVHDMAGNAGELVGGCQIPYSDPKWCNTRKQGGVCIDPHLPRRNGKCAVGRHGQRSTNSLPVTCSTMFRAINGIPSGFRCAQPTH